MGEGTTLERKDKRYHEHTAFFYIYIYKFDE